MHSLRLLFLFILFIHFDRSSLAQNNFWKQTNGPTGGRISAIAVDLNDKIYCGTFGGNVFQSSNHGQVWEQIGLDETHNNILSIITTPDGYIYFASDIDGIFRATGHNKKWETINNGLTNLDITALANLPDGTLFAGTKSGLYRSINHGNEWTKLEQMDKPTNFLRVYRHNIYAISIDTIFSSSSDGGKSWQQVKAFHNISIRCLAIANDSRFYAGTQEGDVLESGKGNDNWKKIAHFDYGLRVLELDQKGNLYAGLGGPSFSNEGGGVYRIPLNGAKPELVFTDHSNAVWCIGIGQNKLYAGTNKGVYQSNENGASWIPVNSGLIAQSVQDIIINKKNEIFVGSYGGIFYSDDYGNKWTEVNNGLTNLGITDMAINQNGHIFAGTYTSDIFRSTDNGKTWLKTITGLPENNWISCLEVNSQNQLFVATRMGVFRSKDNGDSWMPVNKGLENSFYNSVVIDSEDVLFAGNSNGNVFRSDNLGDDWQKLPVSNPINDAPAELAVDSENQLYFGSTNLGVFRYADVDHKWIPLNHGLTNTTIRSLIIDNGGTIFAGTGIPGSMNYQKLSGDNFYKSTDKGKSWSLTNSGLNHPRIRTIAINSKGIIFAGSVGGGVYRSLFSVPVRN